MSRCAKCKFYCIGLCLKRNWHVREHYLGCEDYVPDENNQSEKEGNHGQETDEDH